MNKIQRGPRFASRLRKYLKSLNKLGRFTNNHLNHRSFCCAYKHLKLKKCFKLMLETGLQALTFVREIDSEILSQIQSKNLLLLRRTWYVWEHLLKVQNFFVHFTPLCSKLEHLSQPCHFSLNLILANHRKYMVLHSHMKHIHNTKHSS